MTEECPVTFRYHGRIIKGHLTPVQGCASESMFFLMSEDLFYYGKLWYSDGWRFASQDRSLDHLAEWFGGMVSSWLDCREESVDWVVSIPDFGDYFRPMEFEGGEVPRFPVGRG